MAKVLLSENLYYYLRTTTTESQNKSKCRVVESSPIGHTYQTLLDLKLWRY